MYPVLLQPITSALAHTPTSISCYTNTMKIHSLTSSINSNCKVGSKDSSNGQPTDRGSILGRDKNFLPVTTAKQSLGATKFAIQQVSWGPCSGDKVAEV